MNIKHFSTCVVALFGILLLPASALAQSAVPSSSAVTTYCDSSISAADCAMAERVANKLAAVITLEHTLHTWPPDLYVHDQKDEYGNSTLNAFAHACGGEIDEGMPSDCTAPEGSTKPHVHFTKAILDDVVQGDESRLALIMGHEMGHITSGHTTPYAYRMRAESEVGFYAFGRQQEIISDIRGTQYGLEAGYSLEKMLNAFYKFINLDLSYSSFEGLGSSHPSWEERLTFIDEDRVSLWRSMMAFKTGVSMLASEQYSVATNLFRNVVAQFPDSYEAQANLGYAQLMDYLDQLEPADIQAFGVGQIVVGAFTRRPESMEPAMRGINTALWFQATTSLQSALRLNPRMAEARANLGIAYLVQPNGGDKVQAQEYLTQAVQMAVADPNMDSRVKAAIFINAGVADLAQGLIQESFNHMVSAETEINMVSGFVGSPDRVVRGELEAGLYYNTALILSSVNNTEAQTAAADYYHAYLSGASPSSNWWQIAYNQYVKACGAIGRTPNTVASYKSNRTKAFRTLSGITFINGTQVTLGQPIDEFINDMVAKGGDSATYLDSPVIENTDLNDYSFYLVGTSVFATQEVLSVQMYGTSAPTLTVQESGLGASSYTLRVGMTVADLDHILGSDWEKRLVVDFSAGYRFYRDLGLAVRVQDGLVAELVVTQIPFQQFWEPEVE